MSLLKSIRIGTVVTPNNVFLAPLAGISDGSYRIMGRRFGAGLTFTEMVSADGLVNHNTKSFDLLKISRKERPTSIQLFGSNPEIISAAASICSEHPADVLDINGGCSVRKVMTTGSGARILTDPDNFYRIVKACVNASLYPVSVKIRLGLTEGTINVVENALAAQEAGASLLTLHPRTAASKYSGSALWEYIGTVKSILSIPVCGNGDIRVPSDAVRMIIETGCDAVMIGRAAIGNPWVLRGTVEALQLYPQVIEHRSPTKEERVRCALEHLHMIVTAKGEERGIKEVRRVIRRYLKGIPSVSGLRGTLFRTETKEEFEEHLLSLLDS